MELKRFAVIFHTQLHNDAVGRVHTTQFRDILLSWYLLKSWHRIKMNEKKKLSAFRGSSLALAQDPLTLFFQRNQSQRNNPDQP
jgi:hypothetical protein